MIVVAELPPLSYSPPLGLLMKKTQLLLCLFNSQPAPFARVCLPVQTSGCPSPIAPSPSRKSIAVEINLHLYALYR